MQLTPPDHGAASRPFFTTAAADGATRTRAPADRTANRSTRQAALAAAVMPRADQLDQQSRTDDRPQLMQTQLARALSAVFPDIRAQAKASIEARILSDHGIALDADRTYYNTFSPPVGQRDDAKHPDNGFWLGHPTFSRSLTDMFLTNAWPGPSGPGKELPALKGGIYREGAWANRFDNSNKIDLTPQQARQSLSGSQFYRQYAGQLRSFWNANFDTLQTLTELQVLDYMETHRRAGNRAQALGISPALGLSDEALAMVAEASGRRDPDMASQGVQIYDFNINGWSAEDMVWLQSKEGRVVLYMPGDARPLREYRDVRQMQDDIRQMTQTQAGRDNLAGYFSEYNRRDGPSYWGVKSWLSAIAKDKSGQYDYAIADHYKQPVLGKLTVGMPDERARRLLSDKAVNMVSGVAGYPEPDRPTLGTRAYWLDINGIASTSMLWLQANDGHVVLLTPGEPQAVREYANLDALRTDIMRMASDEAGRDYLARQFAATDRASSTTFEGIDHWLRALQSGNTRARERIAFDAHKNALNGQVFHAMLTRRRQQELGMVGNLAAMRLMSDGTRTQIHDTMSVDQRFFNTMRLSDDICDLEVNLESSATQGRIKRSPDDDPVDACLLPRSRPLRWGRALAQRMRAALDRLRPQPASIPQQAPGSSIVSGLFPRARANEYAPLPGTAPTASAPPLPAARHDGREVNALGFLERCDLQRLYRVEIVSTDPRGPVGPSSTPVADPLRAGFVADRDFDAGRRALAGPVIDAYLTREAAWQAFNIRNNRETMQGEAEFRLYQIEADGLTAVSLGDNEANNPQFANLMTDDGIRTMVPYYGEAYSIPYSASPLRRLEGDMVQLRLNADNLITRTRLRERRQPNRFGGVDL